MEKSIIEILKASDTKKYFKKYGITNLYLFWSYSRWENKKNSDLDLLIDYDRNIHKITLLDLSEMESYLHKITWIKKIDFVTRNSINRKLVPYIEKDLIQII